MDEDLDEHEMNALRQKALSTLHPKDTGYDIDTVLTRERPVEYSRRSIATQHQPHVSGRDPYKLHEKRKDMGAIAERGRTKKKSSSRSSSHSYSGSRSFSSYSSSGSSTSGSRSPSSTSVSHSSYSSYTRSSYSSSRRSFSTSPHSHRITAKHFSLGKRSHSELRTKKVPPPRYYPSSSQWYEDNHKHHSVRSPPRSRRRCPPQSHHTAMSSRDYHDTPPAKRHRIDFPTYHRGPLHRYRLHSPPPPPLSPAMHKRERIIRHVRRSPPPRSPPQSSRRALYSRRSPSPLSHYPLHRHNHRRGRSYSPQPPPTRPRDLRPRRELVSEHILSRSSRDMRALCGPPIHVRERFHRPSPERRMPHPLPRRSSYKLSSSSSRRSRRINVCSPHDDPPVIRSAVESGSMIKDVSMRHQAEMKRDERELREDKSKRDKASVEDQGNSCGSPSLTSPNNAQLLWDEEEVQLENEKEEETAEGKEEGEVEELDYDESMEDLDLHPTGNIDEEGTCEASRLRGKSDERPGTVSWDDPQREGGREEDDIHGDDVLGVEDRGSTPEHGGTAGEDEENKGQVHISSPIRVSPDRKKSRGKCSPHKNEQGKREKKLSVKERLYVSKNTIEEKRRHLGRYSDGTSRKLPRSLANRLGPSPSLHGKIGRRSDKSGGGHKGSALAIAAEYKRKKQAGEISPREVARATRITKRINAPDYRPPTLRKPKEKSEENERELDKRIDSIKKRNIALEKRYKEIERDKQLYA